VLFPAPMFPMNITATVGFPSEAGNSVMVEESSSKGERRLEEAI
jgi:hypothetical protein